MGSHRIVGAPERAPPSNAWRKMWMALGMLLCVAVLLSVASSALAVAPKSEFFGVTSFGQLREAGETSAIQQMGLRNIRNNIVWENVQRADCADNNISGLDWRSVDDQFTKAARENIRIIADLYGTRVNGPGCGVHEFPSPGTRLYEDFIQPGGFVWQVVQRYGYSGSFWRNNPSLTAYPVRVWEVWNEPNHKRNNPGGVAIQPQKYAKLLIDTANTIRNASRAQSGLPVELTDTKVLMGGLGQSTAAEFLPVETYLRSMYSAPSGYTPSQLHAAFDGLSYHPYRLKGRPEDVQAEIQVARNALNNDDGASSDREKTLWLTEIGWALVEIPARPEEPRREPAFSLNEVQQGSYLRSTFRWIYSVADALRIKYAAWFAYKDSASSCRVWECWETVSGLKRIDGSNRPSWCGYSHFMGSNLCEYIPPGGYRTDTYQTVTDIFHGQPGYVGIVGNVYINNVEGAPPVNNVRVNINFYREPGHCVCESGSCPYVETVRADVINGHYEYKFASRGVDRWCTQTVLYAQGNYAHSTSRGFHRFQIKSGYRLVARHSDKCLSVSANNRANGTPLIQWACDPNRPTWNGQVFTLIPMEPNAQYAEFKVNHINAGEPAKCIDVEGANTADGARLVLFDCFGGLNQQWDVIPISGQEPFIALMARHSGKCMDVEGQSTANGARILQWWCYWGSNQQWSWQVVD